MDSSREGRAHSTWTERPWPEYAALIDTSPPALARHPNQDLRGPRTRRVGRARQAGHSQDLVFVERLARKQRRGQCVERLAVLAQEAPRRRAAAENADDASPEIIRLSPLVVPW